MLTEVHTFDALACPTLAAVARYALSDADVVDRLLRAIERLRRHAGPGRSVGLGALGASIRRESGERLALAFDRQAIGAEAGGDLP